MITNGLLYIPTTTGGGFSGGDPVAIASTWGSGIPCNIKTNNKSNKGVYAGGSFTICSYEILLEMQAFAATTVKLETGRGVALGEFKVQDVQFMDSVQRVKIIV